MHSKTNVIGSEIKNKGRKMLLTLPVCIFTYIIVALYLHKRYDNQDENGVKALLPNNKRNMAFLIIYMFSGFLGGFLFEAYGYTYLDILRCILIIHISWVLAYIDKKEKIIPNRIVVLILLLGAVFLTVRIFMNPSMAFAFVATSVTGMIFGGGVFLLCRLFSKKGIGMGDVKLLAALGFYFGMYTMVGVLMISLFTAAVASLYLVLIKKNSLKVELAFAPFIAIGVSLGLFLGF